MNSKPPIRSDSQIDAHIRAAVMAAIARASAGEGDHFAGILNEEIARQLASRDPHRERRMPPRVVDGPPRAVDLAGVAAAGQRYSRAKREMADAKAAVARAGLAAYLAGCPADQVARSAGVSYSSLCRWSWAYFDSDDCEEGKAFRKAWRLGGG